MKATTIIVCAALILALTSVSQSQTPADTTNLPQTMHLCTDHCETLVWMQDHYDGTADNTGALQSRYTVKQWSQDSVDLTGTPVKSNPLAKIRANFRGSIAPDGGSIVNPKVTVYINSAPMIKDAAYRLTWDAKPLPAQAASAPLSSQPGIPAPVSASSAQAQTPEPVSPAQTSTTQTPPRDLASEQAMLTKYAPQLEQMGCNQKPQGRLCQQTFPKRLYECEVIDDVKRCGTWDFANGQYTGRWPDQSAQGQMIVTLLDPTGVQILREDFTGSTKGLRAIYEGKWNGSQVVDGKMGCFYERSICGYWTAATSPELAALASAPPAAAPSQSSTVDPNTPTLSWTEASKLLMPIPSPIVMSVIPYPAGAKSMHASGELWLSFLVSPLGQVTDVKELITGTKLFLGPTVDHMKDTWRFRPYLQDGVPSAMRSSIHIKFEYNQGIKLLDK